MINKAPRPSFQNICERWRNKTFNWELWLGNDTLGVITAQLGTILKCWTISLTSPWHKIQNIFQKYIYKHLLINNTLGKHRWRKFREDWAIVMMASKVTGHLVVMAASLGLVRAGLLGAGTGEGSCAAPPFRSELQIQNSEDMSS